MGIYDGKNAGISEKFCGEVLQKSFMGKFFGKFYRKFYGGNFTKKSFTGEMGNQV